MDNATFDYFCHGATASNAASPVTVTIYSTAASCETFPGPAGPLPQPLHLSLPIPSLRMSALAATGVTPIAAVATIAASHCATRPSVTVTAPPYACFLPIKLGRCNKPHM